MRADSPRFESRKSLRVTSPRDTSTATKPKPMLKPKLGPKEAQKTSLISRSTTALKTRKMGVRKQIMKMRMREGCSRTSLRFSN